MYVCVSGHETSLAAVYYLFSLHLNALLNGTRNFETFAMVKVFRRSPHLHSLQSVQSLQLMVKELLKEVRMTTFEASL